VCGVVDYDYENYKIEPRFAADITEVIELVAPQNLEIFQVNDLVNLKWSMQHHQMVSGIAQQEVLILFQNLGK